jgi:hypothetical protein
MIRVERDETARVILARGFLDDPRLSLRARGLLATLLARGGAGDIDLRGSVAFGERPGDVETALRELERAGYFARAGDASDPLAGTVRETSTLPLLSAAPAVRRRTAAEADSPEREKEEAEAAERVLAALNELRASSWTWARYTPLSAKHAKNVEHIRGRLREGYAVADLVLVLEYLASVDGGKDASRRYFDSVTPFNTKNFERNLAMARDWEARGRPATSEPLALQRADGHDPAIYEKRVRGGGQ